MERGTTPTPAPAEGASGGPLRYTRVRARVQEVAGTLVADPELVTLRLLASGFLLFDAADPDRPINVWHALRRLLARDPDLIG